MKKIIFDTDPGIDDAVALALAINDPNIDIKLITTVSGNVNIDKTTRNALEILNFLDKDIPVAKGASRPLLRKPLYGEDIHGITGMDGFPFSNMNLEPISKHAVEAMKELILLSEEPITIIAVGPLTNVALLLATYPEVISNIEKIVFMGGTLGRGNRSAYAEFNIFADAEAAKMVFHSGISMVMCDLEIGHKCSITGEILDDIKDSGKTGKMINSILQNYRSGSINDGLNVYDSTAVAYVAQPDIFETVECFVDVDINDGINYGSTPVDLKGFSKKSPNMKVCIGLNTQKFYKWFVELIRTAD